MSTSPLPSIRLITTLGLPALATNRTVQTFGSRCTPSPTQNSKFPCYVSSTRPFLSDPTAAIIVFSIRIVGPGLERDDFVMVVHRKALLNLVPLPEVATTPTTFIPWNLWGPPVTRWLIVELETFAPQINMHSCGQRYVKLGSFGSDDNGSDEDYEDNSKDGGEVGEGEEEGGEGEEEEGEEEDDNSEGTVGDDSIIIYDFNPWRVRDAQLQGGGGSWSQAGDICVAKGVFKFDIVGKLPYVQIKRSKWTECDNVMIDEERVISVQASVYALLSDPGLTAVVEQTDEEMVGGIASMDIVYLG